MNTEMLRCMPQCSTRNVVLCTSFGAAHPRMKPDRAPPPARLPTHICVTRPQWVNRPVSQVRAPPGGLSRTSGKLWQDYTRTAICFEHKKQYLLIRAPYTRIVVCWHISNIPPMISLSQISCNTSTLYLAAIFVRYCHTTGSWLL